MGSLTRMLMVWWLVLAVPAQGMAAVSRAFCGSMHVAVGQAGHAGHDHAQHASLHAAAVDVLATDSDLATPTSSAQPADNHKCSACASCCSVAAIMTGLPTLPAAEAASTRFGAVVVNVDAFALDGPERPPRSALA
jgi:hypothetical protein